VTSLAQRIRRAAARREDSLAVQSVVLTAARAAGLIITFAIPLVLVRTFDQTQFGLYKQLFLISGTAIPILNLGLYASLFYFMPREEEDGQRYALQAIWLLTFSGSAAAIALMLGRDALVQLFHAPALRDLVPLLAFYVLLSTPAELFASIPVVDRRSTVAAYVMTVGDVVRAALVIGAAVIFRSLTAVLWASIIVTVLRGIWMLYYIHLRRPANPRPMTRSELADQLKYSLPFALAVLFGIGLVRFHEYYVSVHTTTAQFAVYAVGILELPLLGMLVQTVAEVMQIRASGAFKASDQESLRHLWLTALSRLWVIIFPCWAVTEILGYDLIALLFGTAYLAAVPVFRVSICAVLLWTVVDHGILRATGDTPFLVKANAIGLVASIAGVLLFARYSVMMGGIIGYIIGLAAMRVLGIRQVGRRLSLTWRNVLPWSFLGRLFVVVAVSALAAVAARALVGRLLVPRLIVSGAVFLLTYVLVALRLELVPRQDLGAVLRRFVPAT